MFDSILAQAADPMGQIASLGAAGFMGAMWLWERRTSQKREAQLDDAHARILADRVQLDVLVDLVKANTEAMTRLSSRVPPP